MPTPHRTTPCRGHGGREEEEQGVGGGGPRLTRLQGQKVSHHRLATYPDGWDWYGGHAARQIVICSSSPDPRVLLLCSAVHRMQHRGVPRPMSAWSALFGHCPNTSPSPAIHLGPAGRPGGRCLVLVLLSSMEGAYGADLPVWAKLEAGRPAGEEEWKLGRSTDILHGTHRSSLARPGRRG